MSTSSIAPIPGCISCSSRETPARWRTDSERAASALRASVEAPSILREALQERGGLPVFGANGVAVAQDRLVDAVEAHVVRPEHRSAAVDRESIAVDPDDVDVVGTCGHAFLENLRAFVHHHVIAALEDLLVAHVAALDAAARGVLDDELLDEGIGRGIALLVVAIEAGAGLLAVAAHLADAVEDVAVALTRAQPIELRLAIAPAHVEPREIGHREVPHRKSEVVEHLVDLPGQGAFLEQEERLAHAFREHAVADEAVAHADQHRHLADLLAELLRGREDLGVRFLAAHVLDELHDVRGTEEVHAHHVPGSMRRRSDLVDVEVGRVRGEYRAGLRDRIELAEDLLLDSHLLEHRLDDHVGVREIAKIERGLEESQAPIHFFLLEAAASDAVRVVLAYRREAAIERILRGFHDGDRNARVGEAHGDAAAHGSRADHARRLDLAYRRIGGKAGDLGHLALGEEHVALRARLRRIHEGHEKVALELHALVERLLARRAHRLDR